MSTWRTILQVSKGNEKRLSKEIFIEWGNFSGRFTKSNIIWFSIHNNIIYHQTDEAWVYTRATRQKKLKLNENTWFTHV